MNKNKFLLLIIPAALIFFTNQAKLPGLLIKSVGMALLRLCLLIAAVIYFAFNLKKADKKDREKQLVKQLTSKNRQRIVQLRNLGMNIKNKNIGHKTEEICQAMEKILSVSEKNTDKMLQADEFFNTYLTALGNILTIFARLETSNNLTADVATNTVNCLEKIKTSANNHIRNILQNDIMDIAIEMEALLAMAKRDGLLAEEVFSFNDEQQQITLVL